MMSLLTRLVLTALVILLCDDALAQQSKPLDLSDKLLTANTLNCRFMPGISANWMTGAPKLEQGHFSATGLLIIRAINVREGTAIYAGNVGESTLRIWVTPFALHFIEATDGGSMNVTTVYAATKDQRQVAVHSRHVALLGQPATSQYHGLCEVVN